MALWGPFVKTAFARFARPFVSRPGGRRCLPRVEELEPRLVLSPFGVASSAEYSGAFSTWAPKMAQAGATQVRIFPEWRGVQPSRGTWNWSQVDSILATAANNNLTVSGLFLYNAPWLTGSYPTGSGLSDFSTYVSGVVTHCQGSVENWEVWNEPQNFGAVPAAAYANLVSTAYDAAKAADPNAQIGMSVASVDVVYLEQAILAGAADHFDFIAVHPYEGLGTAAAGQEANFMSIVPTIRKMLAADDPALVNVPIWFTELGEATSTSVTPTKQAQDLVKAYSMSIAEGVACVDWFEAMGTIYHMGLLDGSAHPTLGYTALQNLTAQLSSNPQYLGWVQLNNQDYGFVFQGATTTVLATWAPPGSTDNVDFGQTVQIMDPLTGGTTSASTYSLTNAPVLVAGLPSSLVTQAQANVNQPFPWGGDYTGASSVSVSMGAPNTEQGLHQVSPDGSSTAVLVSGVSARDCSRSSGQSFTVDPNFLSYTPTTIRITAVVRRVGTATAGFNLKYESTIGRRSTGSWYTVPGSDRWYTQTWTITDDEFVSKWGYNFAFDSDSTTYSRYYLQSVTVTILGQNLALHRPASASSSEAGHPPDQAFDGNPGTRWSSQYSDLQWIEVDLGSTYNITHVVLNWEAAYGRAYQIQVSTDDTNWTTIYSTTTGQGGFEDLTGLSGTGRYVRMYGTQRGTQWGYSLWEFEVYGTPV
jgi:hypothetical protein